MPETKVISFVSLNGGQGKTTIATMVARLAARRGQRVLCIDLDPQKFSLTLCLYGEIASDRPSALEFLKGCDPATAMLDIDQGLALIPSDLSLQEGENYLQSTGATASILRRRLATVEGFDLILIDAPPQRSHLAIAAMGASDSVIIPCEVKVKGVCSLSATMDTLSQLTELGAFQGRVVGVVPFRDRFYGLHRDRTAQSCFENLQTLADRLQIWRFASVPESALYLKATDERSLPSDIDAVRGPGVEVAIHQIVEAINGHS